MKANKPRAFQHNLSGKKTFKLSSSNTRHGPKPMKLHTTISVWSGVTEQDRRKQNLWVFFFIKFSSFFRGKAQRKKNSLAHRQHMTINVDERTESTRRIVYMIKYSGSQWAVPILLRKFLGEVKCVAKSSMCVFRVSEKWLCVRVCLVNENEHWNHLENITATIVEQSQPDAIHNACRIWKNKNKPPHIMYHLSVRIFILHKMRLRAIWTRWIPMMLYRTETEKSYRPLKGSVWLLSAFFPLVRPCMSIGTM